MYEKDSAAPTAGSCGVIPAVFLAYEECFNVPEDKMVKAMFVSAGVGAVIAENASIAGASGGCQAEIGSARQWQRQDLHILREAMQSVFHMRWHLH